MRKRQARITDDFGPEGLQGSRLFSPLFKLFGERAGQKRPPDVVVRRESAALPGVDALRRLIVIAQGHGDRARSQLIAAFLLSLVDQRRDRFDLHLLATEDPRVRDDCLTVVALAYGGGIAHLLQNEVEIFQHLAKRWGLGRGKQG